MKQTVVTDACKSLAEIGSESYFQSEAAKLMNDAVYRAAEMNSATVASASQAEAQAAQNSDPWLAAAGVRDLWERHSSDIVDDWPEVSAFNVSSQSKMVQMLVTDTACSMIEECNAYSPWTIDFCASYSASIQCPPGYSFSAIVSLNLSPAELVLYTKMRDRLVRRFPSRSLRLSTAHWRFASIHSRFQRSATLLALKSPWWYPNDALEGATEVSQVAEPQIGRD